MQTWLEANPSDRSRLEQAIESIVVKDENIPSSQQIIVKAVTRDLKSFASQSSIPDHEITSAYSSLIVPLIGPSRKKLLELFSPLVSLLYELVKRAPESEALTLVEQLQPSAQVLFLFDLNIQAGISVYQNALPSLQEARALVIPNTKQVVWNESLTKLALAVQHSPIFEVLRCEPGEFLEMMKCWNVREPSRTETGGGNVPVATSSGASSIVSSSGSPSLPTAAAASSSRRILLRIPASGTTSASSIDDGEKGKRRDGDDNLAAHPETLTHQNLDTSTSPPSVAATARKGTPIPATQRQTSNNQVGSRQVNQKQTNVKASSPTTTNSTNPPKLKGGKSK